LDTQKIGRRVIAAPLGETGALELLDVLTRPDADRAALIGRLSLRADGEWLAELLIDLEEDEPARLRFVEALRKEDRVRHVETRQPPRGGRRAVAVRLPSQGRPSSLRVDRSERLRPGS
jgi:hypothetical protein